MAIIVKKFGGATVSSAEKIKEIAFKLKSEISPDDRLVVVVSAMGKTTNNLIELAHQVSSHPSRREMDMLLSVGERISMSLLSMALLDLGLEAISFTGSQAGILTTESHENAFVVNIKPFRLIEELNKNKVIILAGFQGVSELKKEITTLGRGGSDTTAVAMAAALGANHCEILKDVPSIFTADPNLIPEAKSLISVSYEPLMEMTFWGAKVLHYRSVELAAVKKVKIYIGPSQTEKAALGTWVDQFEKKEYEMVFSKLGINNNLTPKTSSPSPISSQKDDAENAYEQSTILSINSHKQVLIAEIVSSSVQEAIILMKEDFLIKEIIYPQILHIDKKDDKNNLLYFTAPNEVINQILRSDFKFIIEKKTYSTITLTGTGFLEFDLQEKIFQKLKTNNIEIFKVFYSAFSLSLLVNEHSYLDAIKCLHPLILNSK